MTIDEFIFCCVLLFTLSMFVLFLSTSYTMSLVDGNNEMEYYAYLLGTIAGSIETVVAFIFMREDRSEHPRSAEDFEEFLNKLNKEKKISYQ